MITYHTVMIKIFRYDPLCEHLKGSKAKKQELLDILANCLGDQKQIMGEVKGTILLRKLEESKLTANMGSLELEMLRVMNRNAKDHFPDIHILHIHRDTPSSLNPLSTKASCSIPAVSKGAMALRPCGRPTRARIRIASSSCRRFLPIGSRSSMPRRGTSSGTVRSCKYLLYYICQVYCPICICNVNNCSSPHAFDRMKHD